LFLKLLQNFEIKTHEEQVAQKLEDDARIAEANARIKAAKNARK